MVQDTGRVSQGLKAGMSIANQRTLEEFRELREYNGTIKSLQSLVKQR
jgi:hypothetical protein